MTATGYSLSTNAKVYPLINDNATPGEPFLHDIGDDRLQAGAPLGRFASGPVVGGKAGLVEPHLIGRPPLVEPGDRCGVRPADALASRFEPCLPVIGRLGVEVEAHRGVLPSARKHPTCSAAAAATQRTEQK